jgi:hypothetical protein
MTPAERAEIDRWHADILREDDPVRLARIRAAILDALGKTPRAPASMARIVVLIEGRNLVDRRLADLGSKPAGETTPRRKFGRARGYIAGYTPERKTRDLLDAVRAVLDEYREHWPLTCRQVFYRLVGTGAFEKSQRFYKRLIHHVGNARRGRLIPFAAIRDDGVSSVDLERFDDEEHFKAHVRRMGERYRRNLLASQPVHVEVWCEAAGMIFQLADVAHEFSVPVYSSSGFDSITAKHDLAARICRVGKPAVVLHLGDYDPSGESIFDSASEDVAAFVEADRPWATVNVRFRRVALTAAQVEAYDLPTAPAGEGDSRAKSWTGETCQLEALAPDQIAEILRAEIKAVLDPGRLAADLEIEAVERRSIALALPSPEART